MYNLYRFEKDAQEEEQQLNKAKSAQIMKKIRSQERDQMVKKYKKRVTEFVGSLEKAPVRANDEYLTRLKQEEAHRQKTKFMGNESMMYDIKTEEDRVNNGNLLFKVNCHSYK